MKRITIELDERLEANFRDALSMGAWTLENTKSMTDYYDKCASILRDLADAIDNGKDAPE